MILISCNLLVRSVHPSFHTVGVLRYRVPSSAYLPSYPLNVPGTGISAEHSPRSDTS